MVTLLKGSKSKRDVYISINNQLFLTYWLNGEYYSTHVKKILFKAIKKKGEGKALPLYPSYGYI